jgi:hypothetical protein
VKDRVRDTFQSAASAAAIIRHFTALHASFNCPFWY